MKYIEIAVPDDFDDKAFEPADALAVATHVSNAAHYSREEIGAALLALHKTVSSPLVEPYLISGAPREQVQAYYALTPMVHALKAELRSPRHVVYYARPSDGQEYAVKPNGRLFEVVVPQERRKELTGEAWEDFPIVYDRFEDAKGAMMLLLQNEPDVTIIHVFAFHGQSVGGFDWHLDSNTADRALKEQRRDAVAKKDEAWAGYRFELAIPAHLHNDAITRLIDSDLDHYCAERGEKHTIYEPMRRDIVLDSPSP